MIFWLPGVADIRTKVRENLTYAETKGLTSEASFVMPYFYLSYEI
jgi:hypothetical protein